MFRIVEVFKSIQSEGTHAGKAATFIRFYGCNLACDFGDGFVCDEPLHTIPEEVMVMDIDEILLNCIGIRHIVITGGEPSLQNLSELIKALQTKGHYVQVETNGYSLDNIKAANWITYSPKLSFSNKAPILSYGFQEVKLLASKSHKPDTRYWNSVIIKYVQPIALGDKWDMDNVRWCHDFVVNNPDWKLSLQTHKIYGAD